MRAKLCRVLPCWGSVFQHDEMTPLLMGVPVIAAPATAVPPMASKPALAATVIFMVIFMVSPPIVWQPQRFPPIRGSVAEFQVERLLLELL
jgi:hypothetical protein